MKKWIAFFLMGTMLLLGGCSTKSDAKSPSLYSEGIEVVSQLKEMSESEGYLSAFTMNDSVLRHLEGTAVSDPAQPTAVYQLTIPDDKLLGILDSAAAESIPDSLRPMLKAKLCAAVPTQINAMGGSEVLAASSLCMASKNFLCEDFTGNTLYLYLYEDGAPVMVAFSANEEHIVSATGCYLLGISPDEEAISSLKPFLSELSVEITEVTP